MSCYDYQQSQKLQAEPFYALIMAAMHRASTNNLHKLQAAWPQIWRELQARHNAPGGYVPGEMQQFEAQYG